MLTQGLRYYRSALRKNDRSVYWAKGPRDREDWGKWAYQKISPPGARARFDMVGKHSLGRRDDDYEDVSPPCRELSQTATNGVLCVAADTATEGRKDRYGRVRGAISIEG